MEVGYVNRHGGCRKLSIFPALHATSRNAFRRLFAGGGKLHRKTRALTRFTVDGNLATVSKQDLLRGGQAETRARGLGGVVGSEDLALLFGRDAHPGVAHGSHDRE